MKAQEVLENMRFERKIDPKKGLGIGSHSSYYALELARNGLIRVPEGEYVLKITGFFGGSKYRSWKNTAKKIFVKGFGIISGRDTNDGSKLEVSVKETFLRDIKYQKRNQYQGGSNYYISVPIPENTDKEEILILSKAHKLKFQKKQTKMWWKITQNLKNISAKSHEEHFRWIMDKEINLIDSESVHESLDFRRGINPKESLGLGIFKGKTPDDFMEFILEDMSWNDPIIDYEWRIGRFEYDCLPGQSVIGELKEAAQKFGWGDILKINKDPNDWGSRSGPDGSDRHYYHIQFKAKYKSAALQRFDYSVNESIGVGGYSAEQCERDTRDILKNEYGQMDVEEVDIKKFLNQQIAPAFENDTIYDYDSLYDFILQVQK